MARGNECPRCDKPSINYRCGGQGGASFELADFDLKDFASTYSEKNKKKSRTSDRKSAEILSTRELISAIGSIWDYAAHPLSVLLPKSSSGYDDGCLQKCYVLGYSSEQRRCNESVAAEIQNPPVNMMGSSCDSLPKVHANMRYLKVEDKIFCTQPSSGTNLLLKRLFQDSQKMPRESWKEKCFPSIRKLFDLEKVYGWTSQITHTNSKYQANFTVMEKHENSDCYVVCNTTDPASFHISVDGSSVVDNLIAGNSDCQPVNTKLVVSSSGQNETPDNMEISATTLWSEHAGVKDIEVWMAKIPNSKPCIDSLVSAIDSGGGENIENETSVKPDLQENKRNQERDFVMDNTQVESYLPMKAKSHYKFAKQEHAFAGAMAGIFVSLCLHPVDTIKTVVQSCSANPKSVHDISRSIISERGVTGLYRGISTNIASSAPISAVYIFTYESVKGTLLAFFPKEYQSLAHCLAGGCASVATSFIFTPSECIKQQMQVGSRYQNCWNALVGIIEKGGLPSLYAGWGAVLCRNIPHSIIKFYTYESLKQLISPFQLNGQTNTLVMLVSGGLAGSTAALFTTPFDVVKTRLQTQNPGSINQYNGVFDTLKELAKNEGLKGLYRGLTPRLFMYMTQGALFFASYESFKRLFSLEVSEIKVQEAPHKKNY